MKSVTASLANCPANYPNDTVIAVLNEFSTICTDLGYPAPNFLNVSIVSSPAPSSPGSTTSIAIKSFSIISGTSMSISVATVFSGIYSTRLKLTELLGTTSTTIGGQLQTSGLSSGAIGGIVGGVVGGVLLISMGVVLYFMRHRRKESPARVSTVMEYPNDSNQKTNLAIHPSEDIAVRARLHGPNDDGTPIASGRLAS